MIGRDLAHYRITAPLGAGGMGEVYRATDAKLRREVAIKVLPPDLARDRDRLGRFRREARLLAILNHPNIAAIYGLEEADGKPFLVLELVEGEDLRERLMRGAIPLEEALDIAIQIADALEEAHSKNIVHRDLKPANVRVTPGGKVKVLDFGLARAWAGAGEFSATATSQTQTEVRTATGAVFGTVAYMPPEQARGKPVDQRADVWSFGVLLVEMLTGRPLFSGGSVADVMAAVMTKEPDLGTLPAATPAEVRHLLWRCLRKDPRTRWPDIGAARLMLQDALAAKENNAEAPRAVGQEIRGAHPRRMLERWVWLAATLVLAGALGWSLLRPSPPGPVARYGLGFPPGQELLVEGLAASFALAPDGSFIVYVGPAEAGGRQLWVKLRDSPEAAALSGTTGAGAPSVSPDGNWIAFLAEGELRKIPRLGGSAITLAHSVNTYMHTPPAWLDDGSLLFVDEDAGVRRVPPEGGTPEVFWTPPAGRYVFTLAALPDSRGILFTLCDSFCFASQEIWSFDLRNGEAHSIVAEAITPVLAPTGHLVYARPDGGLYAMPFNVLSLEATGAAARIMANVKITSGAVANFALARDGTLLVLQGAASTAGSQVEWVTRQGNRTPVDPDWTFDPGDYNRGWALSPDGSRLALRAQTAAGTDIWIKELPEGPLSRLTFDEGADRYPRWTPDGESVTFLSNRNGNFDVWVKRAGGTGAAVLLLDDEQDLRQGFWSPDGEWLVLETAGGDILALRPGVDSIPTPLLAEEYDEHAPSLSPDSRWLAYMSVETGRMEVFVRPFPDVDAGKWQISTDGGMSPLWAHSGRELFYVTGDREMVAAQIETTPSLRVTERRVLFRVDHTTASFSRMYDVAPDDQRFLMVRSFQADTDSSRLILVENWAEELKKRAGN